MDLSIVIPVRNEADNIAPLVAEIMEALSGLSRYEIIYVDDGSNDGSAAEIERRSCACCAIGAAAGRVRLS
jgi:dolichol-phosphate mannosyltransferase